MSSGQRLAAADARRLPLPAASVQCIVTSPPYWGLRDYGLQDGIGLEPTLDGYIENMRVVARELWRVLRDDGTLWLNIGDAYAGSGGAHTNDKNPGISKSYYRDGAARATSTKQRSNPGSMVASCVFPAGLKPKDLIGLPWRVAFALQDDGWYLRSDIIWHKPNPMPESVRDRPTRAHEYLFLLTKKPKYYYDADAVREPQAAATFKRYKPGEAIPTFKKSGGSARKKEGFSAATPIAILPHGRNRRTVWTIPPQSYRGAHFATFPEKLVEPCILAGSRPGDLVLDPFCGSGTTGAVAKRLGRRFVGFDLQANYLDLARERIAAVPEPQPLLWPAAEVRG